MELFAYEFWGAIFDVFMFQLFLVIGLLSSLIFTMWFVLRNRKIKTEKFKFIINSTENILKKNLIISSQIYNPNKYESLLTEYVFLKFKGATEIIFFCNLINKENNRIPPGAYMEPKIPFSIDGRYRGVVKTKENNSILFSDLFAVLFYEKENLGSNININACPSVILKITNDSHIIKPSRQSKKIWKAVLKEYNNKWN